MDQHVVPKVIFFSDKIIIVIIIACPFPLDIIYTVFPLNLETQHELSKGLVISPDDKVVILNLLKLLKSPPDPY